MNFVYRWILLPLLVVLTIIKNPIKSYKRWDEIKLSYKILGSMLESGW